MGGCTNSSSHSKQKREKTQNNKIDIDKNKASFSIDEQKKRTFSFQGDLYIEQQQIGSGGFSDVFLYRNQSKNSLHALKILKDKTTIEALLQEFKMMKDVECQFIIKIEDFIQIDDQLCIMMEYANQGTLDKFISSIQHQTLSISASQILDLVCDIFSGLNVLHSKKIIHRDLKMDNLLVSNYQIKIADLGVATYLISKQYAQTKIGNILYAAPEKMNDDNYNSASDIFSAGLIVLQVILGLQDIEVIKMKINDNYTNKIQDSPESLRNFIETLLDKNHQKRPSAIDAYNQARKLKYDQEVLNYINQKITGFQQSKQTQQTPITASSFGQQIKATQSTTASALNSKQPSAEEEALFQNGMQHFWKTSFEQADECFSKILEKNPVSIQGLLGKLLCGHRFRDWINKRKYYTDEWVQEQLKLIQKLNPNHYLYYFCLGVINSDADSMSKCLEMNPSMAEAYAYKGSLLMDKQQTEEAIQCGQQALALNGDSEYVLRIMGLMYMDLNVQTAEKFFLRSLSVNPNQFLLYYNLGVFYKCQNQFDKAIEYYNKAISICPYSKMVIEQKLIAMEFNEQHQEVINYIQYLNKEHGELDFLNFRLAQSYRCLQDIPKALLYYKKSLLYEDDNAVIHNIACIYQDERDYEKAKEYFQRAADKKYKYSYLGLYNIYSISDMDKAKEYMRQVLELELDNNDEEDCFLKIAAYRALEQYKEFFTFSEQALKKHPLAQEIVRQIMALIGNEEFKQDLPAQFKLAEMIQKNQGINLKATLCQLKYLTSSDMMEIVPSYILKYLKNAINNQQNLEIFITILEDFKKYYNKDILYTLYKNVKEIYESKQDNVNCLVLLIFFLQFNEIAFTKQDLEDIDNAYYKNNLFDKYEDQQIITYIKIKYLLLKMDQQVDAKNNIFTIKKGFDELLKLQENVDLSFRKRFLDYNENMVSKLNDLVTNISEKILANYIQK